MTEGIVRVAASTFEWGEDIDIERAEKAKEKAEMRLKKSSASEYEHNLAEIKLKKSLARLSASS